jgi:hypothetical protein
MTNEETPNEEGMTKLEARTPTSGPVKKMGDLGIRASFVIRIYSFDSLSSPFGLLSVVCLASLGWHSSPHPSQVFPSHAITRRSIATVPTVKV